MDDVDGTYELLATHLLCLSAIISLNSHKSQKLAPDCPGSSSEDPGDEVNNCEAYQLVIEDNAPVNVNLHHLSFVGVESDQ